MQAFRDSKTGRYALLARDFCIRDIILTDTEISKLQIAFNKSAKIMEEKTVKRKRGRPPKIKPRSDNLDI